MTYITLDFVDLAIASLLLIVSACLTMALNLGLTRSLLINATRMAVQLTLIGLVLKAIFAATSPLITAIAMAVMIGFGAYEISARQARRFKGFWTYGLGAGTLLFSGLLVTGLALGTQIRPDPWYDARYALPILGMVLGNTMTGVALSLDRLINEAERERLSIEARLALGETIQSALNEPVRSAMRAGLMPMINSMASAGLVFLPGMMTGQILAGVEPVDAVKYQILIFLLLAGATSFGVIAAVQVARRLLSDDRQRLRLDRVRAKDS